jgi:Tol biopolymer transport system component
MLDLLTRAVIQITDVAGGASMPQVSPDGGSLAFVSLADDEWQLYVAPIPEDVEGAPITIGDSIRVSEDDAAQHILPYWSPDGLQLLASQNTADELVRMMIFDPALVTSPKVIGPFGSVAFGWTRDGSGIHFDWARTMGHFQMDLSLWEMSRAQDQKSSCEPIHQQCSAKLITASHLETNKGECVARRHLR